MDIEECPDCGDEDLSIQMEEETFIYGDNPGVQLKAIVEVTVCASCGFMTTGHQGLMARHKVLRQYLESLHAKEDPVHD